MAKNDLTFTLFSSVTDRFGERKTLGWDEWCESYFFRFEVRGSVEDSGNKEALNEKKKGPAVVLGTLHPKKPRGKKNVLHVHALSLDVEDQEEEKVLAAFEWLNERGLDYCVHTTHKSGSEVAGGKQRLRVVIPLDRPITPVEHKASWLALNEALGHVNDPQTKDASRLNFLPSTFDMAHAFFFRGEGRRRLDVYADLKIGARSITDYEKAPGEKSKPKTPREVDPLIVEDQVCKARHWLKKRWKIDPLKAPASALAEGRSYAVEGERHETMRRLTWALAKQYPEMHEEALEQIFEKSLEAMAEESGDAEGMDAVLAAWRGAVVKAKEFEKEDIQKAEAQARGAEEQLNPDQYSEEELDALAEKIGVKRRDLNKLWIVQREGMHWFLQGDATYDGPYSKDDAFVQAGMALSRSPCRLTKMSGKGIINKPIPDLVRSHGCVAKKVISDLAVQGTIYNPRTKVVHEAVCPRREITPVFNESIDRWIKIMAGDKYEKFVDWLSAVPKLDRLNCAIYLDGIRGSGKTLLPHGLARIWTEGAPADPELVLSGFNDEVCRCPLVFIDEKMPEHKGDVTATLRNMLSVTDRTLKRKYKAPTELSGAIRMVLSSNNENLLSSQDSVATKADMEAVAERFLYIKVPDAASQYLATVGKETLAEWKREGIAAHTLWLHENHAVQSEGSRFVVEGTIDQMHRSQVIGNKWTSYCCQWLVNYLQSPGKYDGTGTGLIRKGDGQLLVCDKAIIDDWNLYISNKRDQPETTKVNAALRAISTGKKQLRVDGRRIWYRIIDIDNLLAWAEHSNFADAGSILEAIGSPDFVADEGASVTDEIHNIPRAVKKK